MEWKIHEWMVWAQYLNVLMRLSLLLVLPPNPLPKASRPPPKTMVRLRLERKMQCDLPLCFLSMANPPPCAFKTQLQCM